MWWTFLVAPVKAAVTHWFKGKELKARKKLRIEEIRALGEVQLAKTLAHAEANYDNLAQMQMQNSSKDEFLVGVMSFPFILSFLAPIIDGLLNTDITTFIGKSWEMVGTAPDWYQWSLLGIIISTFGLRWAAKGFSLFGRKGGK